MKLSTKARYGLRLCFLIGMQKNKTVPLSSLVNQTGLSEKYLEQILAALKKRGILNSKRGATGGYSLAQPTTDITLKSIFAALDNDFAITDCATDSCGDEYCPNKFVMKKIYDSINSVVSEITLQDMIDEHKSDCTNLKENGL